MSEVITVVAIPPVPVFLSEGKATTTSRDVAEFFGKRHDNLLRDIDRLECSEAFNRLNFEPVDYIDAKGEARRMYRLTRDGFTFLAMGFTGHRAAQFKEAFITAFNAMEAQLSGGVALPALAQAVGALVQRQAEMETKVNAILDLVDVTKRYVTLLEGNQRPGRRTKPYATVTPAVVERVMEMAGQGYSIGAICLAVDLPRGTVHRIKHGQYSANLLQKRAGMVNTPGNA